MGIVLRRERHGTAQAVLYGAGYLGVALATQTVVTWVNYFYAPPQGKGLEPHLSMGLVGVAMVIGRIVDAVADPVIGAWSDNTNHRLGRRIPFILFGAFPLAASLALIWMPPVAGESIWNFVYLAFILSAFFFSFTVVVAPYLALLPEIAANQSERVGLAAWQAFFNIIGLAIAMVGSALLIEHFGFKTMGIVLGAIALISYLTPGLTVQERRKAGEAASGLGLIESVKLTFGNKPFLWYAVSQLFFWFGFNIVMLTVAYIVTVLMGLSEGDVGLALGVALVVSLLSFPIITRRAKSKGTKKALMWTMWIFAIVLVGLATIGRWPLPLSPAVQGFIVIGFAGIPLAGLFILPNAIMAEVADYDESLTGKRREAIYFGVQGLLLKASIGLSSGVTALILNMLGYDEQRPWGIVASGPVAAVFVLIGLWAFKHYPLGLPQEASSASPPD